jgi:hypothetical protein
MSLENFEDMGGSGERSGPETPDWRSDSVSQSSNIDIVVSRFNENIEYLNTEPFNQFNIIVYNKGPYEINYLNNAKILTLPNVGRESHTYLHHIITNYNNLPDIIIFLPGSCLAKNKKGLTYFKIKKVLETKSSVFGAFKEGINYEFSLEDNINSNKDNLIINTTHELVLCPERPFGKWFEKNFENTSKFKGTSYNGVFAVHKKDITKFPISYYENLIKYLNDSENTECGHYFERSWPSIFDIDSDNIYDYNSF